MARRATPSVVLRRRCVGGLDDTFHRGQQNQPGPSFTVGVRCQRRRYRCRHRRHEWHRPGCQQLFGSQENPLFGLIVGTSPQQILCTQFFTRHHHDSQSLRRGLFATSLCLRIQCGLGFVEFGTSHNGGQSVFCLHWTVFLVGQRLLGGVRVF